MNHGDQDAFEREVDVYERIIAKMHTQIDTLTSENSALRSSLADMIEGMQHDTECLGELLNENKTLRSSLAEREATIAEMQDDIGNKQIEAFVSGFNDAKLSSPNDSDDASDWIESFCRARGIKFAPVPSPQQGDDTATEVER